MSSIFENAHDDSSAASIEGSENDVSTARADENVASTNSLRSDLQTPMALARLNSHPQLPDIQPHQHSTLFYLSLIEGRCRTQAANAINAGRRPENHLPENHHEVQNLAQHLFGEMTKEYVYSRAFYSSSCGFCGLLVHVHFPPRAVTRATICLRETPFKFDLFTLTCTIIFQSNPFII